MKGATVGRKDDFSQLQPLDQKFLKLSKVHQTCKGFGSVFATVLCTVGDGKSQKLGRNAAEGTTKSGGFSSKNRLFFVTKSGGLEIYSEQNPLF